MAVCKIKSVHKWKNKSISQTLFDVIDYALNGKKCEYIDKNGVSKILASTYESDANSKIAADEWAILKNMYKKLTGRDQGDSDVLAYHIIQSFDPKENINPELAGKIGMELAQRLTGGEFSFAVGTHLDKKHTHNHIVINSTALDATHKFRDVKKSFENVLKSLNDEVCKKYGLSIIEDKNLNADAHEDGQDKEASKSKTKYIHWLNRNFDKRVATEDKPTWQNILREVIDLILGRKSKYNALGENEKSEIEKILCGISGNCPEDFNEFVHSLRDCGYEVKGLENKYISVRAKGQKNFTRLRATTLGDEYTRNSIIDYIEEYNYSKSAEQTISVIGEVAGKINISPFEKSHLNKIIDVQNNKKVQTSVGYEHWAKLQNLKTLANTHSFLAQNNLTWTDVSAMYSEKEEVIKVLEAQKETVQRYTDRQKEIVVLQNHLIQFVKNRKVFEKYKKSGYSKIFKGDNADALEAHNQARKYFDEYKKLKGIEKLPTMQELKTEYTELKKIKSDFYDKLKAEREELKLLQTLKTNSMELFGIDEDGSKIKTEKELQKERDELIVKQKERLSKEHEYKKRNKILS